MAIMSDVGVPPYVVIDSDGEGRLDGVIVRCVAGIAPRLVRFDGELEDI